MTARSLGSRGIMAALALVILAVGMIGPVSAQEIPLDRNGLPMWKVKTWKDFPVRITLPDAVALQALLDQVPIASFDREQIRPGRAADGSPQLVFEPRVTAAEEMGLRRAGYIFESLPDLEKQMRQEMERAWAAQAAAGPEKLLYGDKGVYHTHAQIGALLAQAANDHPSIAQDFVWGFSVEGRELWGIVISDNVGAEEAEPEVRLSSTMHGDEPPGMEMLLYLVDYLTNNYGQPGYEDVTNLVDNYEIHILPLHNPDGYVGAYRTNSNGVDLNRNFPVPNGTIGDDGTWTEEIETLAAKDYGFLHNFVISENGHAGALVVNYPWDYTYTLAPDDAALIKLSLEYSTYNLPMYNGAFSQGITNGAQWYVVHGSLQDWSYHETGCIDVTIELNNTKWPSASLLDGLWDDNRESLMHWIKAARYGVNGVVTGSDTGLPLAATVTVAGNAKPVYADDDHGDYYKLLDTGTYDITFSADGYIAHTEYGVSTVWGTPTVLNVALDPVAHGDIAGHVRDQQGAGLDADVEVRTHPGDEYVTTVQSSAAGDGAYSVNLVYGDYRLIATSSGYLPAEEVVTLDAAAVTQDFTLSASEEVTLFGDDFESGAGSWTGGWGLADPATGHSPPNSMTDSPGDGIKYARNEDNACVMASAVDLSGALSGTLTFWAKWDIEASWDCCVLSVSTNGGADWSPLATAYTEAATGQGAQQPAGMPVFDGSQTTWVENSVDLTPYLGQADVRFRFWLGSDTGVERDGFYFDDFQIVVLREAISGVEPTPEPVVASLLAYPNPFNPQTTLRFAIDRAGPARLVIYDLQGRLVRTLLAADVIPGLQTLVWDGRTDHGAVAASGVYFARLRQSDRLETVKLMLVK